MKVHGSTDKVLALSRTLTEYLQQHGAHVTSIPGQGVVEWDAAPEVAATINSELAHKGYAVREHGVRERLDPHGKVELVVVNSSAGQRTEQRYHAGFVTNQAFSLDLRK